MNDIKLIVERFSDNGRETLSNIYVIESGLLLFSCVGMELPWKDNEQQISCIPLNSNYACQKVKATAAIPYEHIWITNVKGRSGVCIHKANFVSSLRGCIAVGDKHVDINKDNLLDITNSGKTFKVLMALLPDVFSLEIKSDIINA